MRIGGLQKISFIDFPGRIAAVVFTQGCNWRCRYCHNPSLVLPARFGPIIAAPLVMDFLAKRKDSLEGLVISGGEPTLQGDLPAFIDQVRDLGYPVKLDSNGSRPEVLHHLISGDRLAYVAMDLKAPFETYSLATGCAVDRAKISDSIKILQESGIDYELRTTVVPGLHSLETIAQLLPLLRGSRRFRLQVFVDGSTLDPMLCCSEPFPKHVIAQMADVLRDHVEDFKLIDSPHDC